MNLKQPLQIYNKMSLLLKIINHLENNEDTDAIKGLDYAMYNTKEEIKIDEYNSPLLEKYKDVYEIISSFDSHYTKENDLKLAKYLYCNATQIKGLDYFCYPKENMERILLYCKVFDLQKKQRENNYHYSLFEKDCYYKASIYNDTFATEIIEKLIEMKDYQFFESKIEIKERFTEENRWQYLKYIENQDENICLEAIKQNATALYSIEEPTTTLYLAAVKQNKCFLCHIKQTATLCMEAVKYDGLSLCYVEQQTAAICIEAVKQNGLALRYVEFQTEEICMKAVKQNGLAIQYVKKQNPKICMKAVKQNRDAFQYVKSKLMCCVRKH